MKRHRFPTPARKKTAGVTFTATSADVTDLARQLADASATLLRAAPDLNQPHESDDHAVAQAKTIMAMRHLTTTVRHLLARTGIGELPGPPERPDAA